VGFDYTSLSFTSPSFSLVLDTTPANDLQSDTFPNGTTSFSEVVDGTGFPISPMNMLSSTAGTVTGRYLDPTNLSYTGITLTPVAGGYYEGRLSFNASAVVPEPALPGVSLAGLAIFPRRRRNSMRR
jgi:hypothetical protein